MKKNLDFYPHRVDSHRHPKFKLLRQQYGGESGWAMEARFWALNNLIAESEMCRIDLSKKRNLAVVSDELGLSMSELEQFLEVLISDDIELLNEITPGVYSTKKVIEVFETADLERQKWRDKYHKSSQNTEKNETPLRESQTLQSKSETPPRVPRNKIREDKIREDKKVNLNESEKTETAQILPFTPLLFSISNFLPEGKPIDRELVKAILNELGFKFPSTSEISRIFNLLSDRKFKPRTAYEIAYKTLTDFHTWDQAKKNLPYFATVLKNRMTDRRAKALEEIRNQKLAYEKADYSQPVNNDALQIVNQLAGSMKVN